MTRLSAILKENDVEEAAVLVKQPGCPLNSAYLNPGKQ